MAEKKKLTRKDKFKKPQEQPSLKKSSSGHPSWLPAAILAILAFILYSNTLNHYFVLDDYSVILENRLTKQGPSAIPEIFKTSYRYGYYFTQDDLYRPIVKAMYAFEWGLTPGKATIGHWINVLLYSLTALVLFQSLKRITGGKVMLSFIATALFIAHPVHTEVVANIKSRDEMLAFLFGFWAIRKFYDFLITEKAAAIIGACILYFLALMSKESAITLLGVFPLVAWFFTDAKPSKWIKPMLLVFIPALLFLLIRNAVLGDTVPEAVSVADNLLNAAKDPSIRFSTAVYILGLYLKLLFFPHPLVFDYSYNQIPLTGPGEWPFLVSAVVYLSLLAFAILKFKSRNLLSFSILYFLVTISVYSNLLITIGSSMGERFLYMPGFGFCFGIAVLLRELGKIPEATDNNSFIAAFKKSMPVMMIFLVIIIAYTVKTISRNPVWKDNFALYSNDVHLSPNSTRTHYYLGNYLVKPEAWEGKPENEKKEIIQRGLGELKKAIEIYPAFTDAYIQMGVGYYKLNMKDSAIISYQKALEYNPQNATIHNNIGTVFFDQGRYDEAQKAFTRAIQLDPRYAEAYANSGSTYGMLKQYDMALTQLFQAVKWDPNYAQAYYFIGMTYQLKGDQQNATINFNKAYKLDPSLKPAQ
jgi:protein O-mannosyl-transferase